MAQKESLAPTGQNHGYTHPLSFCAGHYHPTPCPKFSPSSCWMQHLFVLDGAAVETGLVPEALLLLQLWVLKLLQAPRRQKPHFLGYFPIFFLPTASFCYCQHCVPQYSLKGEVPQFPHPKPFPALDLFAGGCKVSGRLRLGRTRAELGRARAGLGLLAIAAWENTQSRPGARNAFAGSNLPVNNTALAS